MFGRDSEGLPNKQQGLGLHLRGHHDVGFGLDQGLGSPSHYLFICYRVFCVQFPIPVHVGF